MSWQPDIVQAFFSQFFQLPDYGFGGVSASAYVLPQRQFLKFSVIPGLSPSGFGIGNAFSAFQ